MAQDITVPVADGFVNVRVGAIIIKDERVLMVRNSEAEYYYSVGGRIQFGESAEEAVRREVLEETGCALEVERLGFVHEDFFLGDSADKLGRPIYEIGFYFYMKTPAAFEPVCRSLADNGAAERLEWVPFDTPKRLFPTFFRTELAHPVPYIRHMLTDERET